MNFHPVRALRRLIEAAALRRESADYSAALAHVQEAAQALASQADDEGREALARELYDFALAAGNLRHGIATAPRVRTGHRVLVAHYSARLGSYGAQVEARQ